MSLVNNYKPNINKCNEEYKAYNGQLSANSAKIKSRLNL